MNSGNDAEKFLNGKSPEQVLLDWFLTAKSCGLKDPNAMTLSTLDAEGHPSSRIVLCKEIRDGKVLFYTNYLSSKGLDIARNPHVAINFFWDPIYRQIKIRGIAEKTSRQDSESYWQSRPRESQLTQTASLQSKPLTDRSNMEQSIRELEKKFTGKDIPCPANWGGYAVSLTYVEFWVGQANRFHDRYAYRKVENSWSGQRLYP